MEIVAEGEPQILIGCQQEVIDGRASAADGGKPALALMVDGGMDGLYQVRRLLDSRRGGWN